MIKIQNKKWVVINGEESKYTIVVGKNEEKGIMILLNQGGNFSVEVVLAKPGAKALILGIITGNDQAEIKLFTQTRHLVANTHAETMIHGVLRDSATAELKGIIKIDRQANQATDFLTEKMLVLSSRARAMIEPALEIKANEVRASHAATVTTVDEDQVYYLMSRGITKTEAELLIVEGFIKIVLDRVNNVKIKKQICLMLKK